MRRARLPERLLRRRIVRWGGVLVWAGIIYYFSSLPRLPLPSDTKLLPVVAHFTEYAVLTLLLLRALDTHDLSWRHAVRISLALAFTYAVADEYHQSFVPNRHPSATDIVVDTLGIGIVLTAAASLHRRRELGRA